MDKNDEKVEFALACLKNMGHDIECGACMEIAFTGLTTNAHTCAESLKSRPVVDIKGGGLVGEA